MGCANLITLCSLIFFIGIGHAQVPITVMRQLRKLSKEQFIDQFLRLPPQGENDVNGTVLTGAQGEQLSSSGRIPPSTKDDLMANVANADHCAPHLVTVPVPQDPDPRISYFPFCILMERCAGCEGSDAEICAPVESSIRHVEVVVLVARYYLGRDQGHFGYNEQKRIFMEKHEECETRCKIQDTDCDYRVHSHHDDQTCQCVCKNAERQSACRGPKRWDAERCDCMCPYVKNCNSRRSAFNTDTCRCERRSLSSASELGLHSSANDPNVSEVNTRGLDNRTVERLRGMIHVEGRTSPLNTTSEPTTTTPEPTTTTQPTTTTTQPTTTTPPPCICGPNWVPDTLPDGSLRNGVCRCRPDFDIFGGRKRRK